MPTDTDLYCGGPEFCPECRKEVHMGPTLRFCAPSGRYIVRYGKIIDHRDTPEEAERIAQALNTAYLKATCGSGSTAERPAK